MKKGIILGIIAYLLWGVFPIYWKLIKSVPAQEILCHRVAWSFVFVVIILIVTRKWHWLRQIRHNPKIVLTFFLSAGLLAINWLTYIWAVNSGYIVEASLGYFINPLIKVMLGVIFLREQLRLGQWGAIAIAVLGVLYLTVNYGVFPWIALTLAITFGLYGLLRKTAVLGSLEGLFIETFILFTPAFITLLIFDFQGSASFLHAGELVSLLLIFSGVVTALPLLLFSSAARRITLTALGLLLYIAPTLQFLIGIFIYHEPFSPSRLIGFCIIWFALLLYTIEGFVQNHKKGRIIRAVPP